MDIKTVNDSLDVINKQFSTLIFSTQYLATSNKISWNNYSPGIYKGFTYIKEYSEIIDSRQYSFLLKDKSLFQFYYEWDDGVLLKAKLAYYPFPGSLILEADDLFDHIDELNDLDALENNYEDELLQLATENNSTIISTNSSHLRLDYDPNAQSHPICHLQFGALNEIRIASLKLLNPMCFTHWLLEQVFKNSSINFTALKKSPEFLYLKNRNCNTDITNDLVAMDIIL